MMTGMLGWMVFFFCFFFCYVLASSTFIAAPDGMFVCMVIYFLHARNATILPPIHLFLCVCVCFCLRKLSVPRAQRVSRRETRVGRRLTCFPLFIFLRNFLGSVSSMRAVRSMPVGPAVNFADSTSTTATASPAPPGAAGEAAVVPTPAEGLPEAATTPSAPDIAAAAGTAAGEGGVDVVGDDASEAEGVGSDVLGGGDVGGGVSGGGMTAKERSRSVALSPGCRRCLSCEMLYDLVG